MLCVAARRVYSLPTTVTSQRLASGLRVLLVILRTRHLSSALTYDDPSALQQRFLTRVDSLESQKNDEMI